MLYLIRHEETPLNAEGKFRGSSNPGLMQRGKHAATGTGYRMDGKFDRIVTDGYARTQQTAERIARGVPIEHDEGLSPWNIGDWAKHERMNALSGNSMPSTLPSRERAEWWRVPQLFSCAMEAGV